MLPLSRLHTYMMSLNWIGGKSFLIIHTSPCCNPSWRMRSAVQALLRGDMYLTRLRSVTCSSCICISHAHSPGGILAENRECNIADVLPRYIPRNDSTIRCRCHTLTLHGRIGVCSCHRFGCLSCRHHAGIDTIRGEPGQLKSLSEESNATISPTVVWRRSKKPSELIRIRGP
jgi:hypothetical protein